MCLKEKKILQKFAAILKKFSAQGAKKVDYGMSDTVSTQVSSSWCHPWLLCIYKVCYKMIGVLDPKCLFLLWQNKLYWLRSKYIGFNPKVDANQYPVGTQWMLNEILLLVLYQYTLLTVTDKNLFSHKYRVRLIFV